MALHHADRSAEVSRPVPVDAARPTTTQKTATTTASTQTATRPATTCRTFWKTMGKSLRSLVVYWASPRARKKWKPWKRHHSASASSIFLKIDAHFCAPRPTQTFTEFSNPSGIIKTLRPNDVRHPRIGHSWLKSPQPLLCSQSPPHLLPNAASSVEATHLQRNSILPNRLLSCIRNCVNRKFYHLTQQT